MEESGYTAPEWISLGSYAGDGNRGVATGHLYLARGAYQVNDPDADDLEEQEPLLITRAELHSALMRGEFKVASWTAVAAMALLYSQDG
jgi:hypothetical protein